MNFFSWLAVAILISGTGQALATPAQVLIIRHAEKPDEGVNLSPQGYQRAKALIGFFQSNAIVNRFGPPVAAFATKASSQASSPPSRPDSDDDDDISASMRPIETIQPTAEALKIPLITAYSQDDIQQMIDAIMKSPQYDGKTVIICWHHGTIPEVAEGFGAQGFPRKWKKKIFDRVWVLQFQAGKVAFSDIPQHVLPGDSDH